MSTPETTPKASTTREYLVLEQEKPAEPGATSAWFVVGQATAANDLQAIRQLVASPEEGVQYVAVAMRSWNPRSPSTKTTTKTSWS